MKGLEMLKCCTELVLYSCCKAIVSFLCFEAELKLTNVSHPGRGQWQVEAKVCSLYKSVIVILDELWSC